MQAEELERWVESAARGDADALQRLIVHYHAMLRAKVAAGIDTAIGRRIDADDVLQRAYIAVFAALKPSASNQSPKRE